MTLSKKSIEHFLTSPDSIGVEESSNWDSLYGSHLWANSALRQAIINKNVESVRYVPKLEYEKPQDCFLYNENDTNCNLNTNRDSYFVPNNHSTPNYKVIRNDNASCHSNVVVQINEKKENAHDERNINDASEEENNICIPSISRQVDSSCRQKFSSCEIYCERNTSNNRIRKCGMKGIRCIVSLAVTETPMKKRRQIQACSISIMIMTIVIVSFVLVNFTSPDYNTTNVISSTTVPTDYIENNMTSSITDIVVKSNILESSTHNNMAISTTENSNITINNITEIIKKIRKNIRTYPKDFNKLLGDNDASQIPKEINNRDLSKQFCKCQINEVCMLDEDSGTALCKSAIDTYDPTGCGGLCALDTEACQMVDRARGVRVCRMLALVTCGLDEWRCRNGLCVSANARCDGSIDCYDKSDEMFCDCDVTMNFRCGHSISCFTNKKLCDGTIDCWDGYDEVNCTSECPESQFTCTDGQCILASRFCDGFADCGDTSDEPDGCGAGCGTHELKCGNNRCVSRTARCDGFDHCGDATDELNCS